MEDSSSTVPCLKRYTKAMYYRLLAAKLLPVDLDRILYIDPDTLFINSVTKLYHMDFKGRLFAGASHGGLLGVSDYINRIRLSTYESEGYFNSGVLLMNLPAMRTEVIRRISLPMPKRTEGS